MSGRYRVDRGTASFQGRQQADRRTGWRRPAARNEGLLIGPWEVAVRPEIKGLAATAAPHAAEPVLVRPVKVALPVVAAGAGDKPV